MHMGQELVTCGLLQPVGHGSLGPAPSSCTASKVRRCVSPCLPGVNLVDLLQKWKIGKGISHKDEHRIRMKSDNTGRKIERCIRGITGDTAESGDAGTRVSHAHRLLTHTPDSSASSLSLLSSCPSCSSSLPPCFC